MLLLIYAQPVDQDELSRASATTYIEGASYLFYYDHTDNLLHMAVGLEGKNYQSGVIAVGKNKQTIHILSSNFPTPLAAGYDTQTKVPCVSSIPTMVYTSSSRDSMLISCRHSVSFIRRSTPRANTPSSPISFQKITARLGTMVLYLGRFFGWLSLAC